jgi:hypothetical protein
MVIEAGKHHPLGNSRQRHDDFPHGPDPRRYLPPGIFSDLELRRT